jgi:membrane associated rhomboid family serine protease
MSWLVTNKRDLLRKQGIMLGLIALMAAVFTGQWLTPFAWQLHFMAVPAHITGCLELLRLGQADPGILWAFCTLITYAFLHGGLDHIAGNLLFFWIFGALINELLGWRWLLAVVLITALSGGITHTAMNPESWGPMLGASGVVSGFMGAYLGLSVRWQLPDPHIWPIARPVPPANLAILAVVFVAIDYRYIFGGDGGLTAYGAHVGGFTAGLFLTCFLTPRPTQARHRS